MDPSDDRTFSGRLRALRLEQRDEHGKRLTQEVLAKILETPYNTYTNWERGLSLANGDNLRQLALYFKVSTDYLLCLTDVRDPPPPPGHPLGHEAP